MFRQDTATATAPQRADIGTRVTRPAEVKKASGRSKPLSVADVKRLKDQHAAAVLPLKSNAAEAATLERRVSDVVNAAFGLTPDEVKLMGATAPP